jgi:predicted porin
MRRFARAAALVFVSAAALQAPPAFAESTPSSWNGLPDRFQIDTGYFRLSAQTVLRFNGSSGVDFEKDLGVNQDVNTFWLDATWRVGRRHQLKLGFTRLSRESQNYQLQRDFTWGGEIYQAGLTANATAGADIIGGYYRFAAFRNDRFEIGPAIGVGYLSIDAGIQATGTIGSESRSIDQSASIGSITGALGGYARAWPAKRFVLEGDFLYIKVSPGDTDASVTDWRIGADYYFHHNVGVGVQYKYDKYTYDRGILSTKLGGEITYKGFQIFATFRF